MWTSPLEVFVAWEPESKVGEQLARSTFARLMGDPDDPVAHGPDIPVYYRSVPAETDGKRLAVPWSRSRYCVLVVLADDAMVARKDEWRDWVEAELAEADRAPDERRVLLCALSRGFANLSRKLADAQAIRLDGLVNDLPALEMELLARVSNEICRIIDPERSDKQSTKLFLSHAKRDGGDAAVRLKKHVEAYPVGKVFFDEVSLRPSEEYASEFLEHMAGATLVVLMTDSWASRYWCQWEALKGKELDRPILLVDMLSEGERRHFPYLGNIPTVHCKANELNDADCRRIVAVAQLETLRDLHEWMRMEALQAAGRLPEGSRHLSRSPELATLVTLLAGEGQPSPETCQFVYPDPPIAEHERLLVQQFNDKLKLATPIELLGGPEEGARPLTEKVVAVSISDSPELNALGLDQGHLDRLWVTLNRHLLALGAGVAYGGAPQRGYTDILFDLIRAYADEGRMLEERLVHWYVAWPIHLKLDDKTKAKLPDVIDLHLIPKPADVARDSSVFVSADDDPYAWIRSLTEMRRDMAAGTHARVLVGGQLRASTPRSGIAEEFARSLEAEQPLYLCGGFGGMTAAIIEALYGREPESLTDEFQAATDDRRRALKDYNESDAGKADPIDYGKLVKDFGDAGVEGLRNGLDRGANERLFKSQSVEEIVGLVREGLAETLG